MEPLPDYTTPGRSSGAPLDPSAITINVTEIGDGRYVAWIDADSKISGRGETLVHPHEEIRSQAKVFDRIAYFWLDIAHERPLRIEWLPR